MAATPLPGRITPTASRASIGRAQLHVRWDRVSVLVALVAVLTIVVVHTAVVAVRDNLRALPVKPAPIQAAGHLATAEHKCPAPRTGIIHDAPPVRDNAGAHHGPWRSPSMTVQERRRRRCSMCCREPACMPRSCHRAARSNRSGDAAKNRRGRQCARRSHVVAPHPECGSRLELLAGLGDRTHSRAIVDATGLQPCLFRPPGGIVKGAKSVTHAAGLSMVLWSVDTRDWSTPSRGNSKFASVIRKRAGRGLTQEHPVILLHDGGGNREATVTALPEIINDYRAHGYRFVTLNEPR